ncbi:MAG: glycosyltransferase family 4 protein [Candidatus Sericytochromatia bacterium]|nr:glycosyltransferase family 4 protein [Candidatus Tanganyikabacteria bacterium]
MRIALIAPIHEACPPRGYGGIELVVALLADGLVERGHDVTLFASGDSATRARLRPSVPRALRAEQPFPLTPEEAANRRSAHLAAELLHVCGALECAADFDLIHNHAGYTGIALARMVRTPVVSTLHGPFTPENRGFFGVMRDHPYVAISHDQRSAAADLGLNVVGVVYNGIDTRWFELPTPPSDLVPASFRGRYLLFLGRISPEKGTHVAVAAARRAGLPLVLAGKIDPVDAAYWREEVQPHVDGDRVRFVGEVGGDAKRAILLGARAVLHPVQWPEPFGLVMAEAMAAGVPVIACPRGSAPELVEDGITGFLREDVAGIAQAVSLVDRLAPGAIRESCRRRFDAARMVDDYLAVYERVAQPCSV